MVMPVAPIIPFDYLIPRKTVLVIRVLNIRTRYRAITSYASSSRLVEILRIVV